MQFVLRNMRDLQDQVGILSWKIVPEPRVIFGANCTIEDAGSSRISEDLVLEDVACIFHSLTININFVQD